MVVRIAAVDVPAELDKEARVDEPSVDDLVWDGSCVEHVWIY